MLGGKHLSLHQRKVSSMSLWCAQACRGALLRRVVDFGAGWFDLGYAFGMQKAMNAPGKSPAMCSEF